jgi:hypothetical protein
MKATNESMASQLKMGAHASGVWFAASRRKLCFTIFSEKGW